MTTFSVQKKPFMKWCSVSNTAKWMGRGRGRGRNGTQCMRSHQYNGSVVFLCKYLAHQSYFLKHWDKKDLSKKDQKGYFPVKLCKWTWHLDVKSVIWGSEQMLLLLFMWFLTRGTWAASSAACRRLPVCSRAEDAQHVNSPAQRQKYLQWWFSGLHWINVAAAHAAFIFRLREI